MRFERSLLRSEYGASGFTSILDRMSMEFYSKLGGFVNVKAKPCKGLQSVRGVEDTAHILQNCVEGDLS